jgi:Domain of unknown function (DUF4436)
MPDQPSISDVSPEAEVPGTVQEARAPQPSGRDSTRFRAWALFVLTALAAGTYLAILHTFDLSESPSERTFGQGAETAQRIKIYLEPLSVDPVSDAMQFRVDVAPDRELIGKHPNAPIHDLTLILTTDDSIEERVIRANEPIAPETIRVSLAEGSIVAYPFDRYRFAVRVQAFGGGGTASETAAPIAEEVTVWEGVLGYRLRALQSPESTLGDIRLRFELRRATAHVFFALAAYGAMVVLACSALTISFLIFVGYRRPEATFIGALAALVFALPALRNAIPGAPPLGVRADLMVFLWVELAAVLSIALTVLSWARKEGEPRKSINKGL